jgi:hypothetical protein
MATTTIVAVLAFTGMAKASQAVTYNNPASESPFSLSLDTGTSAWLTPSVSLNSASGINSSSYTTTSTTSPVTKIVNPLPGVKGTYDVSTETTTYTHSYKENYQSLGISYTGGLSSPVVGDTYSLYGQINKNVGQSLLSNNGYLNFNLGMNVNFADPNAINTGTEGILTFKLGNSLKNWVYEYKTPLSLNSSRISLSNSSQWLDMNSATYFEANYSIAGNTGLQFSISNLGLSIYETLYGGAYDFNTNASSPVTNSILHYDLQALPVTPTPIPAAIWLLGSGLMGLAGLRGKRQI